MRLLCSLYIFLPISLVYWLITYEQESVFDSFAAYDAIHGVS